MALRVNDDSNLLFALRQSQINHSEIGKRLARIASGLRINQASDDPAGSSVAEALNTQSRGLNVASRNIQDFTSLAQTADAGLSVIQDLATRVSELSVQSSNGTLTDEDRQLLQTEAAELTQEIDRQASTVEFNGQKLFSGTFSSAVQVGAGAGDTITLSLDAVNSASLGLSGIDISSQTGAQSAIGVAQGAVNSIATERAAIGGTLNRIQSTLDFVDIQNENMLAAQSRIQDADVALEMIGLTGAKIREDAGLSTIVQGNINRQNAVRLLGD